MATVLIAVPTLARHDAVGNDARLQARYLAAVGHEVHLFADRRDPGVDDALMDARAFAAALQTPDVTLVYHFCVYWDRLEALLATARCKVVVKYHNITPPWFFAGYDKGSVYATEQGLKQAKAVLGGDKVHLILSTSPWTTRELAEVIGRAPRAPVVVQPPFVPTGDLDAAGEDAQVAAELADGRVHGVFVGRFTPNKGHRHLVGVASAYRELYGPRFRLTLAGKITDNLRGYLDEVMALADRLGLGDHLTVLDGPGLPTIATLYRRATAVLVLSDHEGFCVPVIEAQHLGAPVIAMAATAVGDTVGSGALTCPDPNYDFFATALHAVATRPELRTRLVSQGKRNAASYTEAETAAGLLRALSAVLPGKG
jgi:glycosyltransferase involved in cell wall biosynthesis